MLQHPIQLAAEHPVKPRPVAPFPLEEQQVVVQRFAIHDCDPLDWLAMRCNHCRCGVVQLREARIFCRAFSTRCS
jgi:hypothetical protein